MIKENDDNLEPQTNILLEIILVSAVFISI